MTVGIKLLFMDLQPLHMENELSDGPYGPQDLGGHGTHNDRNKNLLEVVMLSAGQWFQCRNTVGPVMHTNTRLQCCHLSVKLGAAYDVDHPLADMVKIKFVPHM